MKKTSLILIAICYSWSLVSSARAQIHSSVNTEIASGYVTNTYLDPMLSEWDRSHATGFGHVLSTANVGWAGSSTLLRGSGGGQVMPFMDERPVWRGGFVHLNALQRISPQWSVSAGVGGSRYASDYNRSMRWVQGGLARMITPFSQIRLRAGSSWRGYEGLEPEEEEPVDEPLQRYDFYSVDLEYWPTFRWRLSAAFLGGLDQITSPQDGFSIRGGLHYHFSGGAGLSGQFGLEQFAHQYQTQNDGQPGPFGMPVTGTTTQSLENRMIRGTLQLRYPVSRNIVINTRVSGMQWDGTGEQSTVHDIQVSAGIEISLSLPSRSRSTLSRFNWNKSGDSATLTVRYRDEGQLYLTGDFNEWERPGIPLTPQSNDRYRTRIEVSPGVYNYKLLIVRNGEEEWLELPEEADTADDGFGGENGRIIINNF